MYRYILLMIVVGTLLHAQNPCGDYAPVHQLRWPDRHPPVSIYMPYDVLLGYIAMDSVMNWATTRERVLRVRSFLERRMTFDDTLKKIVRSMYAMADYDPTLYEATLRDFRYPQLAPTMMREGIIEAVMRAWSNDTANLNRDLALLRAHYIAHVKVEDTVHVLGTYAGRWTTLVVTTCRVLDLIKGQVLLPCDLSFTHDAPIQHTKPKVLKPWSSGTPCLQFTYIPDMRLEGIIDVGLDDDPRLGHAIVPGKEYIVMLTLPTLCRDTVSNSLGDYYELVPLVIDLPCTDEWGFRMSVAAYPIVLDNSGIPVVHMPKNEFGWGTEVALETFKQRLRDRITEIRNW